MNRLLEIKDLSVSFFTGNGEVKAVRGISFGLSEGEILGIVGESGSGKSVTSLSILQLLADSGKVKEGKILFDSQDISRISPSSMRKLRGGSISMIFQDPMSSLNPLITVGKQIAEMLEIHKKELSPQERKQESIRLMEMVRIPEAAKRFDSYPHEFSGGMRQRIMIAMALACKPKLLIADEPTTALDVTIQDQILKLLRNLQQEMNMSIIFITHDLGVVAEICHRVVVMYGGMIMEEGRVDDIFDFPMHPYTAGLMKSIPSIEQNKEEILIPIPGSPPDMLNPPPGCPFAPRCHYVRNICMDRCPPYTEIAEGHRSMCWLLDAHAPADRDNPFADYLLQKKRGGISP